MSKRIIGALLKSIGVVSFIYGLSLIHPALLWISAGILVFLAGIGVYDNEKGGGE